LPGAASVNLCGNQPAIEKLDVKSLIYDADIQEVIFCEFFGIILGPEQIKKSKKMDKENHYGN